jgi:hypothetical protein
MLVAAMPALEIDPAALPPEEQKEIERLLAGPKILAEPEGSAGVYGWGLLAALGAAALGGLLFWRGLGVVTSPWASHGPWIAIPYALATATLAIGTFKLVAAIRMARLPWTPGRYLLAEGFLDTRARPLRFRPIADFTRVSVHEGESHTTPLRLFTTSVHFGDEVEKFHLFGTEQNLPRAELDELSAHRDAALEGQRSEGGYRFSRRASTGAAATGSTSRPRARARLADHPWKVAGGVGLLAVAPIYLGVLPALSLQAAERDGSVRALRAAEKAYPYGWISARVRPAIHARFEAARASVSRRIAAERRAPLERLLAYLEGQESARVRVRLVAPDDAQLEAATLALEARIKGLPGATAAPVVLNYQVVSLAGIRVGQEGLVRGLVKGVSTLIPSDVLELEGEQNRFDGPALDPRDPVIEIISTVALTDVFQGTGSRAYAGLTFGFETSLRLPGEPPALLVPMVTIPPPDNLSISRYSLGGDKVAPLGGSKDPYLDRLDDASVYTKQAEQAGDAAGARLATALGAR